VYVHTRSAKSIAQFLAIYSFTIVMAVQNQVHGPSSQISRRFLTLLAQYM
jgi:hypothetical protein